MSSVDLKIEVLFQSAMIELPYSKSIQNRLLVLNYLSKGLVEYDVQSDADDAVLMRELLNKINTCDTSQELHLDCKNAGTVFRFLTAVCSMSDGRFSLFGNARMHQRPIADLVNPLRELGAHISYQEKEGYPPLKIQGAKLQSIEPIHVDTSKSSQFLSALLLISPYLLDKLKLEYNSDMPSRSYVLMTLDLLKKVGGEIKLGDGTIELLPAKLIGKVQVERDWSSAAFFYSLVALSEELALSFPGLTLDSMQGDAALVEIFLKLGVQTKEIENGLNISRIPLASRHFFYDFKDCPDLALPVIACCAGLQMMASFRGLRNLKYKESNRLDALTKELAKLGYDLRETSDDEAVLLNDCTLNDMEVKEGARIATYGDHRMAMTIAPLVIKHKTMTIENFAVVEKSFPTFWKELSQCGVEVKY